jgi:predicted DNA-binding transcriptional regulator
MLTDQLKKIGFSDGEARIYIAALELGETSVARIAKKAAVERTTAYGFLEALKKRGLISVSHHGKKTLYSAESPKKLRSEIEEKERFIDALLPELLSIANVLDKKPKVRFFDSREGIYDIYRETLRFEGVPIHIWMSSPWFDDERFWRDFYMPARIEKKIGIWAILPRNEETIPFAKEDAASLRQTRMTAGNDFTSDILLYGNRNVAIISFSEMTALAIESRPLYDTLRFVFQSHWDSLDR